MVVQESGKGSFNCGNGYDVLSDAGGGMLTTPVNGFLILSLIDTGR